MVVVDDVDEEQVEHRWTSQPLQKLLVHTQHSPGLRNAMVKIVMA